MHLTDWPNAELLLFIWNRWYVDMNPKTQKLLSRQRSQITLHHNEKAASEAAAGCTGGPISPTHLPQKHCFTQASSQVYAEDAWGAMVLTSLYSHPEMAVLDSYLSLALMEVFKFPLQIWTSGFVHLQLHLKRLPKNQSSTKTSENEPNGTSSPIPSQGSINCAFTPLFGTDSNFSLSSDHNSLYFNTAINNHFEVDFKIF